jgi:hypothetical protein
MQKVNGIARYAGLTIGKEAYAFYSGSGSAGYGWEVLEFGSGVGAAPDLRKCSVAHDVVLGAAFTEDK